jgi:Tol biopolymer transport system component
LNLSNRLSNSPSGEKSTQVTGGASEHSDVFIHDYLTGETTLASQMQGDLDSWEAVISGSGQYVIFTSDAANLVSDTNANCDVYRYDRQSGTIDRISRSTSGAEGQGESWDTGVGTDGTSIAYVSLAKNLLPNDTSDGKQIFVSRIGP